jgi:hypothetical protein
MIGEVAPITNTFVSVPADMGDFNCASFIAGIIAGVLDSSKFVSDAEVSCLSWDLWKSLYICNIYDYRMPA